MFALSVAREYIYFRTVLYLEGEKNTIKVRKRRGVILLHFPLPTQK